MKLLNPFAVVWILVLSSLLISVEMKSELVKRDYVLKKFHYHPVRVIVPKSTICLFYINLNFSQFLKIQFSFKIEILVQKEKANIIINSDVNLFKYKSLIQKLYSIWKGRRDSI